MIVKANYLKKWIQKWQLKENLKMLRNINAYILKSWCKPFWIWTANFVGYDWMDVYISNAFMKILLSYNVGSLFSLPCTVFTLNLQTNQPKSKYKNLRICSTKVRVSFLPNSESNNIVYCLCQEAIFYAYVCKPISMSVSESLFSYLCRKACLHALVKNYIYMLVSKSLLLCQRRKTYFHVHVGKSVSCVSKHVSISVSKSLFSRPAQKACFHPGPDSHR